VYHDLLFKKMACAPSDDYVCDIGTSGSEPGSSPGGVNSLSETATLNTIYKTSGGAIVSFSVTPDREMEVNEFALRKDDTYVAYCYITPAIKLVPGVKQDIIISVDIDDDFAFMGLMVQDLSNFSG